MTTWFITREKEDAEADCASLRLRGLDAVPLPCVVTQLLPWPWADGENDTMTVFTSRRAVDSWLQTNTHLARVAATAPATSRQLRRSGIHVQLETEGGAIALAEAVVASKRPARIRYPTSNVGLESVEQNVAIGLLKDAGIQVDRQLAYEVNTPRELAQRAGELQRKPYALVFASPSAVRNFLPHAASSPPPLHVVCFGQSTHRAWERTRPPEWPSSLLTRDLHATVLEVSTR
ncbi:MAG: uroporphyrinogen-III synthase [Archangium sp.]